MTELEATRLKLKCLEMVEGTKLKWWEVIKYEGRLLNGPLDFLWGKEAYEIALGIFVEGKPVWEGDELYFSSGDYHEELPTKVSKANTPFATGYWSWNPPKPKTVMVELLVDDVKHWSATSFIGDKGERFVYSCRKALENLK